MTTRPWTIVDKSERGIESERSLLIRELVAVVAAGNTVRLPAANPIAGTSANLSKLLKTHWPKTDVRFLHVSCKSSDFVIWADDDPQSARRLMVDAERIAKMRAGRRASRGDRP